MFLVRRSRLERQEQSHSSHKIDRLPLSVSSSSGSTHRVFFPRVTVLSANNLCMLLFLQFVLDRMTDFESHRRFKTRRAGSVRTHGLLGCYKQQISYDYGRRCSGGLHLTPSTLKISPSVGQCTFTPSVILRFVRGSRDTSLYKPL